MQLAQGGVPKRGSSSSPSPTAEPPPPPSSSSTFLPDDLIDACLAFLAPTDLGRLCACVCTSPLSSPWVRVAREDEPWRTWVLSLWPSLLGRLVGEGGEGGGGGKGGGGGGGKGGGEGRTGGEKNIGVAMGGTSDEGASSSGLIQAPCWRFYGSRMRKGPQNAEQLLGMEDDERESEDGESEGEDDCKEEGKKSSSSSTPPPHNNALPSPLLALDVWLHIEIREEKTWWEEGKEGKTPSPVLFSAVFSLADPDAFKCAIYHPTHYRPATLPSAVVDREALETLLSDNFGEPYFSLVVDCAAIHAPTGRVARLFAHEDLNHERHFIEVKARSGTTPRTLARTVFAVETSQGSSTTRISTSYSYQLELSFSPSEITSNRMVTFHDAPLELRFYDRFAEQYVDEAMTTTTNATSEDFQAEKDRLVDFFLWFLSARKEAWSSCF